MAATDPQLLASQREGDSLRIRARVPRDLLYFDGHFPGHPLLPGFVQLDWVMRLDPQPTSSRGDASPTIPRTVRKRRRCHGRCGEKGLSNARASESAAVDALRMRHSRSNVRRKWGVKLTTFA